MSNILYGGTVRQYRKQGKRWTPWDVPTNGDLSSRLWASWGNCTSIPKRRSVGRDGGSHEVSHQLRVAAWNWHIEAPCENSKWVTRSVSDSCFILGEFVWDLLASHRLSTSSGDILWTWKIIIKTIQKFDPARSLLAASLLVSSSDFGNKLSLQMLTREYNDQLSQPVVKAK